MSDELILISISGNDRPGLTASITEILGRYNAVIMDIGQADIHHTLSLGILFRVNGSESGNILKEILFKSSELGVHVRFKPVSPEEYENWVKRQGKGRFIITMLGRVITASQLSKVTSVIYQQNLNIDNMKRLTGRPPLDVQDIDSLRSCVEISVRGDLSDRNALSTSLMELSAKEGIDISFQTDDMYRRTRRLICFDMDSTLIKTEVIDELADRAGVGPQVRAVTESAMRGEIDFVESFTRRVALLKGLDVSVMDEIADNLPDAYRITRIKTFHTLLFPIQEKRKPLGFCKRPEAAIYFIKKRAHAEGNILYLHLPGFQAVKVEQAIDE